MAHGLHEMWLDYIGFARQRYMNAIRIQPVSVTLSVLESHSYRFDTWVRWVAA